MLVYQRVVVGTTVGLTDFFTRHERVVVVGIPPAVPFAHQLWRFPKSWGFPQKSKSHRFPNWMFPNIGVVPPNHPLKYI